jgi:hypothetical protein
MVEIADQSPFLFAAQRAERGVLAPQPIVQESVYLLLPVVF